MKRRLQPAFLGFLSVLAAAACGDDGTGGAGGTATGATTGASSGSGPGSSSGAGSRGTSVGSASASSGSTSTGGGSTTGAGTTGGGTSVVRFIAMGDAGEGNTRQYEVATAVEQVCADRGCDFVLYLGDNFYDDGVSSAMDQQFTDKFEMPYMGLDLRFYVVLGNHDYGTLSNSWEKSAYEIEYTQYSDKWYLPSEWYTFTVENIQFFALDTTRLMWDLGTEDQQTWLDAEVAASTATWKIAFGHHPYVSNGPHGNAGNYEGVPFPPMVAGTTVKEFFDASICGKVDVYLSGHDHSRQDLEATCGTDFFVSGAGAKLTDFVHRDDNPVHWEDDQKEGFLWAEVDGNTMKIAYYDYMGNLDFERTLQK